MVVPALTRETIHHQIRVVFLSHHPLVVALLVRHRSRLAFVAPLAETIQRNVVMPASIPIEHMYGFALAQVMQHGSHRHFRTSAQLRDHARLFVLIL